MQVLINNVITATEAKNVAELAAELELPERGVAVAVNQQIVPRAEWTNRVLMPNDSVTVIKAAFGG